MKKKVVLSVLVLTSFRLLATIPFCGVVEGYYGRPWGTEGRISLMKFMGEEGMNTFIYGPKDDPYHHAKWREPYPAAEAADFKKLLKVAKENKIHFYWAIHLGNFNGEYDALFNKLESMYALGVRAYAVFFDDFGSANAELHAEIGNRVINEFLMKKGDCAPLVICPNVYWGSGHPYQKTLGAKLDKSAHIMWTGHWICSDIKAQDVAKITADFQRTPFIWWNWPVNDYCRRKVLLGRTYGIDDCQYAGFVINPMENCEANKISVYGLAEWAKDPKSFDSHKNWENAFVKLYPNPVIRKAMRIFAEHNSDQGPNGHGYRREESVSAKPLCDKAMEEFKATGKLSGETAEALMKLFKKVGGASDTLLKELPLDKGLGWELEGWLRAESAQMKVGILTLKLLNAKDDKEFAKLRQSIAGVYKTAGADGAAHMKKFRDATFPSDKGNVKSPEVSTTVLKPLIETILETTLKQHYLKVKGRPFEAAAGFAAFSNAKALPKLMVTREGKYAKLERIMEQKSIAPGESFGIKVPWVTDYFHAKFGTPEAAKHGIIELSKDGKAWTKLNTKNSGGDMELRLNPADGWRHARYRNTSKSAVSLKLEQFKFDVQGAESSLAELLKAE